MGLVRPRVAKPDCPHGPEKPASVDSPFPFLAGYFCPSVCRSFCDRPTFHMAPPTVACLVLTLDVSPFYLCPSLSIGHHQLPPSVLSSPTPAQEPGAEPGLPVPQGRGFHWPDPPHQPPGAGKAGGVPLVEKRRQVPTSWWTRRQVPPASWGLPHNPSPGSQGRVKKPKEQ